MGGAAWGIMGEEGDTKLGRGKEEIHPARGKMPGQEFRCPNTVPFFP